jgi:hypothetical protein
MPRARERGLAYSACVAKDLLSEALRAAERDVDSQYLANPLVHRPFGQAGWYFLAFCEEISIRDIIRQDVKTLHENAAFADNLIVHTKWPLRWLWQTCSPGGAVPREIDDDLYKAAWQLSDLSMDYLTFESAFTFATLGFVTLTLEGDRIKTSGPMRNDSRFEAYDRFMPNPRIQADDPAALSFLNRVAASVRVEGGRFTYDLNPAIVQAGLESVAHLIDDQFSLPEDWKMPRFTIGQFARVARVLWVLAIMHFNARITAISSGCQNLGFSDALMLMSQGEIVRRLRRYSGIDSEVVGAILEDLSYGGRQQQNPDPALQPIVPLSSSILAISPNLILHSSMERNLSVFLNRLPEERAVYAALSREKEAKSRRNLIENLSGLGFRFWYGQVAEWGGASDIDFAIISDAEKQCLILELKSFIAPAEPREINDRSNEVRRGIEQIRRRMKMACAQSAPLYALMGIDDSYRLTWAVASETSIGANYVQSPDIPVVNTRHLITRLRRSPGLVASCSWLETREYLPIEGCHYRVVEVEVKVGKWVLEWYGLELLADDYLNC